MRIKALAVVLGLFMLVVVSGCGGGNSTPSAAPSLTQNVNQSQSSYFDGLQKMVNGLSSGNSGTSAQGKAKLDTLSFNDNFSDVSFLDNWAENIEGNYSVVQQGGVLTISGDISQNTCGPTFCEGRGILFNLSAADGSKTFQTKVSVNIGGSNTPAGAIAGGLLAFFDGVGNLVVYGLFKAGSGPFAPSSLIYFHSGLPSPQVLISNSPTSGTLSVTYNTSGSYTLKFSSSPPVTFNVTGPTLVGGVHPLFIGQVLNDPSVTNATISAVFDNFSYSGTQFSDCDVNISIPTLQQVVQVVDNVAQEMIANGVGRGFSGQAIATLKTTLESVLEDLQNSQQYRHGDLRLNSAPHVIDEITRTLNGQRGSEVPAPLVDEWTSELSQAQGALVTLLTDASVCS